jgi:hypothetical protein
MNFTENSFPNYSSIVWEKIPWAVLPPSTKVDICQFLSGIKPAVRTHIKNPKYLDILISLSNSFGWYSAHDQDGYIAISINQSLPDNILKVDRDPFPHEIHLGTLLGYPECCCQHIAQYGEKKIDQIAQSFKRENLKEEFKLIDISLYSKGTALISHVPCSYQCLSSLEMAKFLKVFIQSSNNQGDFLNWCKDIRGHFNF